MAQGGGSINLHKSCVLATSSSVCSYYSQQVHLLSCLEQLHIINLFWIHIHSSVIELYSKEYSSYHILGLTFLLELLFAIQCLESIFKYSFIKAFRCQGLPSSNYILLQDNLEIQRTDFLRLRLAFKVKSYAWTQFKYSKNH